MLLPWATAGITVAKPTTDAAVPNTVTIETATKNIFEFIIRGNNGIYLNSVKRQLPKQLQREQLDRLLPK
jgi:hypothetical protein